MGFTRVPLWDRHFALRGAELRSADAFDAKLGALPSLWSSLDRLDLARMRHARSSPEFCVWRLDERLWRLALDMAARHPDSLREWARVLGDCRVGISIPGSVRSDEELDAACSAAHELLARGAPVIARDFHLDARSIALASRCSGASFDLAELGPELCGTLVAKFAGAGKIAWTTSVGTRAHADSLADRGASLLSGAAPWHPAGSRAARLELNAQRVLSALSLACSEAPPFDVEREIKLDPALAYKFIAMLNSPSFRRGSDGVSSVRQGIALLGRDHLAQWLSMLLLRCASGEPEQSVVRWGAAARAKLCEEIALAGDRRSLAGAAFVCGIFSALQGSFGPALPELLARSELPAPIQAALRGEPGHLSDILNLARACERPDGLLATDAALVEACLLAPGKLCASRREAFLWANASA